MKRVLLHICCAPCAVFPLEFLTKEGLALKGLFFNPNIHPFAEYQRRRLALESFAKEANLEFGTAVYEPKIFFQAVDKKEEAPLRCHICWRLRLRETARRAKEQGFEFFTTTLLGSPYQDTLALEAIGDQEGKEAGVNFLKANFKAGFREAHQRCKEKGLYCQNYCGCIYSEIERFRAKDDRRGTKGRWTRDER